MALQDVIQQNKKKNLTRDASGQLVEQSTEEVQSLAQKAGLSSPPITATGVGMLGGTPKQQDMAGSAAQKKAAIGIATAPQQDLATAVRQGQARIQQTGQEAASSNKSQALQELGQLGDRVHGFIEAQRQKLAQANTVPQDVAAQTTFEGKDVSSVKPLLDQLRADPTNMQLMLEVNQALGYDATTQLNPEQINSLYESAVDTISRGAAGNVDDDLTVSDLLSQGDLGYSATELSQLLGVPETEIGSMSVTQIREATNKLLQDEFSRIQENQQVADSSLLGTAERGLAQKQSRDFSASGVRSTEADMQNLDQQIASADQVQFGGKQYSIEELLSDDTISNLVKEYMESEPGSALRQQIDASEPALKDFIARNQALLQDAATQLQGSAGEFQKIQSDNKTAATLGGLISPDLAKALIPEYGSLSASRIDPTQIAVLNYANSLPEAEKKAYAYNLNSLATQFPAVAEELRSLPADQIAKLDLQNPNGKWQNYVREQEKYQAILNTPDGDIQALASQLFNTGDNVDYQAALGDSALRNVLGLGANKSLALLDADGDGRMDSMEEIRSRVIKQAPSLAGTANGVASIASQSKYSSPAPLADFDPSRAGKQAVLDGDKDKIQASLYHSLSPFMSDGNLTYQEIIKGISGQSKASAVLFDYLLESGNLDAKTEASLQSRLSEVAAVNSRQFLSDSKEVQKANADFKDPSGLTPENQMTQLRDLLKANAALDGAFAEQNSGTYYNNGILKSQREEIQNRAMDTVIANILPSLHGMDANWLIGQIGKEMGVDFDPGIFETPEFRRKLGIAEQKADATYDAKIRKQAANSKKKNAQTAGRT